MKYLTLLRQMAFSFRKNKGASSAIAAIVVVISAAAVVMLAGGNEEMGSPLPDSCECRKLADTGFKVQDTLTAGIALALYIDQDYASLREWDQSVAGDGCPGHAYFLYYRTTDKTTNVLGVTGEGEIYRSNLKCHEGVLVSATGDLIR